MDFYRDIAVWNKFLRTMFLVVLIDIKSDRYGGRTTTSSGIQIA